MHPLLNKITMETWRHGDMETWRHGDMETWRHGDTENTKKHGEKNSVKLRELCASVVHNKLLK